MLLCVSCRCMLFESRSRSTSRCLPRFRFSGLSSTAGVECFFFPLLLRCDHENGISDDDKNSVSNDDKNGSSDGDENGISDGDKNGVGDGDENGIGDGDEEATRIAEKWT